MKRYTLALGLTTISLATPSFAATSSVTLYGIVDAGYQSFRIKGEGSSQDLVSGGESGSRWGLRGSEDLGDGLKANYQLESGFDSANGQSTQNNRLFGRASWVGLSGSWGELRAGRQTLAATDYTGVYSPFGTSFKLAGGGSSVNSNTTPRADNSLKYISPAFNNLQAAVSYAFDGHLAQNTDGRTNPYFNNGSDRILSVVTRYRASTWQLVSYYQAAFLQDNTYSSGVHQDVRPREYGVGGTVNVGPVTLHGAFAQHRDAYINGILPNNTGQTAVFRGGLVNGYTLGVSAKLGTGTVLAQYQLSDPNRGVRRNDQPGHTQRIYSLGYSYPLSKRTNLYTYVSYLDGAWFDSATTGVSARDWSATQFLIGMRHSF
ncbi:hypothetical protein CAL29_01530 [Bordetella genomosp. 10]|uniref:Porin domain-containing protein n=1 Tax=Bordetella genomosp. 10 TaxID=1416804 RepID=A0A261SI64_9BORD|nr:porin [Bordetella genomosp. 10]OZI37138.1 hypothetical protein CAL29_01530 [Bordetella genomosp. 10]